MSKIKNYHDLVKRIDDLKKTDKMDLSSDQDLTIAIMNLISIEEHLFFTAEKTEKTKYYEVLKEVRNMRKELLKEIIKDYEGEVWCISKHLLSASMRLMEVGTKKLGQEDDLKAQALFKKAYDLYTLFWGVNMKLIEPKTAQVETKNYAQNDSKIKNKALNSNKKEKILLQKEPLSLTSKLKIWVKKAIDCCIE